MSILRKVVVLAVAVSFLAASGCVPKRDFDVEQAVRALDAALAKSVAGEQGEVHRNAVIYVDAPAQGLTYSGAAGIARADTDEKMTTDHQFFIASVGKPMTAVVIMQLWEEGALGENGLDTTLAELEVFPPEVIAELHIVDGVSYGHEITVRHLLYQTSGLKHVLSDSELGLGDDYPEYHGYAPGSLNYLIAFDEEMGLEAMMRCVHDGAPQGCSPDAYYLSRTWSPWDYDAWRKDPNDKMAGLLNFYLGGMNRTALWRPGEDYHYSDTNYIILGLLIEELTGHSLHHELRSRIFDPLGMDDTYLGHAVEPPAGQWEKKLSDHWGGGYPLVSSGVNFSMDWAGGGEFSTAEDLNTFMRALANGELFTRESTLDEMLKLSESHNQPYAAGIVVWPADGGFILHHNGSCGSWIEYHTAHDVSIVGTVNDLDRPDRLMALRADIYKALAEAGLDSPSMRAGAASVPLAAAAMGGELPSVPLIVLGLSVVVFLSALVGWLVAAALGRQKGNHGARQVRAARWVGAAVAGWNLLFLVAFFTGVLSAPFQLMFTFSPLVRGVLWMGLISIALTLGLVVFTVLAWKGGHWRILGRAHYTLVALAAVGFLWALGQFHLLGLW